MSGPWAHGSPNPWDVLKGAAKKVGASFIITFGSCSQFLKWLNKPPLRITSPCQPHGVCTNEVTFGKPGEPSVGLEGGGVEEPD